jgi:hypothetical protein
MDWAQGVGRSNRPAPTNCSFIPPSTDCSVVGGNSASMEAALAECNRLALLRHWSEARHVKTGARKQVFYGGL